jgi:hypothetical protein
MRLDVRTILPVLMLALAFCCQAQVPPALVGNWTVHWTGKSNPQKASLSLNESGGTWQTQIVKIESYVHKNACLGRRVPVNVVSSNEREVDLRLNYKEVLAGCPNVRLQLAIRSDGSVTGTRSGKYLLTLVRD